jgi:hypothetical protein
MKSSLVRWAVLEISPTEETAIDQCAKNYVPSSNFDVQFQYQIPPSSTTEKKLCGILHYAMTVCTSCKAQWPGHRLDDRGTWVRLPAGTETFMSSTASLAALGPNEPSIQCVPGHSLGVQRSTREADHSHHPASRLRLVGLYFHFPTSLMT